MALAEALLRKVYKLGLIPKIIRLIPLISLFFAITSISWLLVLPYPGFYRNTYISENALMPAQAMSYFRESEWNFVRGYRTEIKKLESKAIPERNEEIQDWLETIGLKTSYQANGVINDTLYGLMHAPRGDDTEAIVLAVPWTTSTGQFNTGGVALGVALLRYFTKMSIWSKNIMIVFPEDGHVALRSWVEAYHTSLDETAGSIEAAIVMEYEGDSDNFDYYEIKYEGLNGQLPNLDLMNTLNTVGHHEGIPCSIQDTPYSELSRETYLNRLKVLLKGIVNLALTGLNRRTPGCEAFSGWQIQALTLRAKGGYGNGRADITQFGRLVDSTFRSVNNLLEKFHQSFFFYLMLSPKHFVSIGTYLPSAVLMSIAFALSAFGCMVINEIGMKEIASNFSKVLSIFTSIELGTFLLTSILPFLTALSSENEIPTISAVLIGLTIMSILLSLLPFFNSKVSKKVRLHKTTTYFLFAIALFAIAIMIVALLIVHFALAISIGVLALPLTFIQPLITSFNLSEVEHLSSDKQKSSIRKTGLKALTKSKTFTKIKVCACLLTSSPFFAIYLIGNYFVDENEGVIILMRGLLTSWTELQCWTWFVVMLGWYAPWITMALSCTFGDFEIDNVELNMKKQQ